MLKKIISTFAIVTLLGTTLAGCGNSSTTGSKSSAGTSEAAVKSEPNKAGGAKKEVIVWGSWSGDNMERLITFIEKYGTENENFTATYVLQQEMEKKLLTAIAGGDVPDALVWDRFNTSLYAPKGVLLDVTSLVERDKIDTSIFYSESIKEMTYDSKLFGLPFVLDNRALFYNKDAFREVGLDPEKPPTTWAELEEMAIKLTKRNADGSIDRVGFALNDVGLFNTWILQAGGQMVTDDLTKTAFNSDAGLSVLNFWDKLLNVDKVYQIGFAEAQTDGEDPFISGKIAIKWDGPWAISNLNKYAAELDYGVAALPAGPNGDRGAIMGGFGIAIANGSKNVDGAWDFAKWITVNEENNKEVSFITGNIPANIKSSEDEKFTSDPHFGGIVENMKYATIRPQVLGYPQIEGDGTIPNLQLFMSGEITAEKALSDAQSIGDKIIIDNRQ